jgi:hypothetical protein
MKNVCSSLRDLEEDASLSAIFSTYHDISVSFAKTEVSVEAMTRLLRRPSMGFWTVFASTSELSMTHLLSLSRGKI